MSRPVYSSGVGRMCPECQKAIAECRCPRGGSPTRNSGGRQAAGSQAARGSQASRGSQAAGARGKASGSAPGKVHVALEKKGRRGKAVTVIYALPLGDFELQDVAKELKSRAGTGGTVKDGTIELQGDQVALARSWLTEKGYA